jgi:hypothetical protein
MRRFSNSRAARIQLALQDVEAITALIPDRRTATAARHRAD